MNCDVGVIIEIQADYISTGYKTLRMGNGDDI